MICVALFECTCKCTGHSLAQILLQLFYVAKARSPIRIHEQAEFPACYAHSYAHCMPLQSKI